MRADEHDTESEEMGKYSATFTSLKGVTYTIDIEASWLSNKTLTLDADPVHLVVGEGKNKFPGLRTTECEINVLSADPMTELFSEDLMAVTVHLHHGTVTDFVGFLETSEWEAPCAPNRIEAKQLVAVDALSAYLQKPCYERSYRTMLSVMDEIKSEINQKLPVPVSYSGGLLSGTSVYGAMVSLDAMQPTDLYAEHSADENWANYGDIIDSFAVATGSTIMMVGNRIKAYYVKDETAVWYGQSSPMEHNLTSTNMSLKMVNSVRRVEQKVEPLNNLDAPDVVTQKYQYLFNVMTDKYAVYHYTDGMEKYWGKGPDWNSQHLGSAPTLIHPICGLTYSDDKSVSTENSEWLVGIHAVNNPVRVYPRYDRVNLITVIDVQAKIHINKHNAYDEKFWEFNCAYPRLWDNTVEESGTASDSTIALMVGNTVINPYSVTLVVDRNTIGGEDDDDDDDEKKSGLGWLEYRYSFNVHPEDLLACDFRPKVLVRSPNFGEELDDMLIKGNRWAKDIKYVGEGYDKDDYDSKTVSAVASGKDFGDVMQVDNKLCQEPWYNGYIQPNGVTLVDPLRQLASAYSTPRQQWQGTVDDAGFEPTKKVWCRGSQCTQMASDWNLRYGEVTVTVMN